MALPKVAAIIADRLNSIELEWMAIGSIAAMAYGEYRVTNDVDVMLTLARDDIGKLTAVFPIEEFYCPPADVIAQEVSRAERGHFNLIHHETAFKADIYIAGNDPLTRWAFQRRRQIPFNDSVIWLAPPEYVVIGKLAFFREGGSEKHLRDIRGMLAATEVDLAFLEAEVERRGLQAPWREARGG
jgi:hypothetical protein